MLVDLSRFAHLLEQALELLGRQVPASNYTITLGLLWQSLRQLAHVFVIGRELDCFLAQKVGALYSTAESAMALHQLHQVLARDPHPSSANKKANGSTDDDESSATMLACLHAVNMAEAVEAVMEPVHLFRIYLSTAIHFERQNNFVASLVASLYLSKARAVASQCTERVRNHAWIFTPNGRAYFQSHSWMTQHFDLHNGTKLVPGSIEHLSQAFRASILLTALTEFNAGADVARTQERLQELRQISISASVRFPLPSI